MNEEISLNEYPSIHYKKFFDRFSKLDSTDIEKWDTTLIIAYFCKKYESFYNVKYSFKFNSTAPAKSYEVFQFRKLSQILSSNPIVLKDYIDWFFDAKLGEKKRRITSLAFITDTNIVNEYKFKKLLMNKNFVVERTTAIPPNYADIIRKYNCNFTTYGELSFFKRCVDSGNCEPHHKEMMQELSKNGMDLSVLDRIK